MPTLKAVSGILSEVSFEMLMSYIKNTFPNMKIVSVEERAKDEYSFVLALQGSDSIG